MKIAILGNSTKAREMAIHCHKMEAEVVCFPKVESSDEFLFEEKPPFLRIKNHPILRVQKSHLQDDEQIPGRTRMADSFRVVYEMRPKEQIEEMLESNNNFFKGLSEEVIDSLKLPTEGYEEFDIVIDARDFELASYLNGSAPAIGERTIAKDKIFYQMTRPQEDWNSLAIVGHSQMVASQLLALEEWLFDKEARQVFYLDFSRQKLADREKESIELQKLFKRIENHYQDSLAAFELKLAEWNELEDFKKVKIKKPSPPQKKLLLKEGFSVLSVDRLIDRSGLFLSIERPSFREKDHASETLALDAIISLVDSPFDGKFSSLLTWPKEGVRFPNEPGLYSLKQSTIDSLSQDINEVVDDFLQFFKRV